MVLPLVLYGEENKMARSGAAVDDLPRPDGVY